MFQKLSNLENSMCFVLNSINNSKTKHLISTLDLDKSVAFHQCIANGDIENIDEWKDANGNYHFNTMGHVHINQQGLKFLHDMSTTIRIKNAIFDVLKGTIGFLLGILSTVIAQIIIDTIKHYTQ